MRVMVNVEPDRVEEALRKLAYKCARHAAHGHTLELWTRRDWRKASRFFSRKADEAEQEFA